MPALLSDKPSVVPFVRPKETTAQLDWAPLSIIDLSKFDAPGGKEALTKDLSDAVRNWGFWTVVGTGLEQDKVDRQLSIANTFFKLPIEERRKLACDFSVGNYFGYREPTRFVGNTDVKENMEMLNIPKFLPRYEDHQHSFIKTFREEVEPFHREVYNKVIRRLLVLFALVLELPEDYFVDRHAYDKASEDHLRYMIYHPRTAEENKKIGDQWTAGHTDFGALRLLKMLLLWIDLKLGSLTLLFSQNVAALQIRTPDNEWKWVKPIEGGITCNAADTISFLTKGYIKSTIHRVVSPPADQASLERLGLFYFVRPGDDVPMVPAPSPVLKREGLITEEEQNSPAENAVSGYEYVRARVKNVHDRKTTRVSDKNPDGNGVCLFKVKNLAVQDVYN